MNLKKFRIEKGYTQKELALISGVPLRTVQQYENKARNIDGASLKTLTSLALALDVKFHDLLEDEDLKTKVKLTV